MYFNTNETSLRTKEPSRKLLRRSIAAIPTTTETSTDPSITNDSKPIAEPTITDDGTPETTVTPAGQTTVNGVSAVVSRLQSRFANSKAKLKSRFAVDSDSKAGFFSKAWNDKLKYNDWRLFCFIVFIIFTVLYHISNSLPGDNHYRLNGFSGYLTRLIRNLCLDMPFGTTEKRRERFSFWFQIIEDLIYIVFPALVLSGYLTCPAIIMNILLFFPTVIACIITFLVSSLGATCGVGLTMIIFAYVCKFIIGEMVTIYKWKFNQTFYLPIINPNIQFTNDKYEAAKKSEQSGDDFDYHGVKHFYLGPQLCNVFVPDDCVHEDGVVIDNSKGYGKSFLIEVRNVACGLIPGEGDLGSLMLHYVTKDSMVYSKRDNDTKKVTIHGTKVTDNGIERCPLMEYDDTYLGSGPRPGVWNEIKKQFVLDHTTFNFIPHFTECFGAHGPPN